ncbi:MAG: hypothetical protein ABSG17_08125 [Spirochaetia bacterium]
MKRAFFVILVCMLPAALFAAPSDSWYGPRSQQFDTKPPEAGPYYTAEILKIQAELGQQKLGDFDVAALASLRERLSIALQKDEYVRSISLHSMALPGLGQFETGDTASGFGFMALNLATIAGTLVGVYYTLPADLRFDRIDYFRDSFSSISSAWNGHSIVDYLPSFGVFLGGMIVDAIIRSWSSQAASREATSLVDSGTVKFTPRIGAGFMGFDVAY